MKTVEITKESLLIGSTVFVKGDSVTLEDRHAAILVSAGAATWPVMKPAAAPAEEYELPTEKSDRVQLKRGRKPSTADLREKLEAAEKADLIPA